MTELSERLDSFESRLRFMEDELHALRRLAQAQAAPTTTTPYQEIFEPQPAPPPAPEPQRGPTPVPVWEPERRAPRKPRPPREPLDLSVLLGARALAWTGGAVTLLGIVFFFV